jgi:maltose alpha-D-glucosyltransferase / alpha-amylase
VFEQFAPKPSMRLYDRGIRRRLAPMLGERSRIELAYSLLFSLPGTPVLRYGEEIGMGENLRLKERDSVRTPMQWSADRNGGFSTADDLVRPAIAEGPYGYESVNVEQQRRDPSSLLRWLIRLIRLRTECPEIGWGECEVLSTRQPGVLALAFHWRGNTVVCVHNFEPAAKEVSLRVGGGALANLMEVEELQADGRGVHRVRLEPHGYCWFRAGGLRQALTREPVG